jgi:DNA-binding transcriptional ArsR family regulator
MTQSEVISALACLSDGNELNIFRLLVRAGDEGLAGNEIAQRLHLSLSALMIGLTRLKEGGLVAFRGDGQAVVYHAKCAVMNKVLAYLIDTCCEGCVSMQDAATGVAPTLQ